MFDPLRFRHQPIQGNRISKVVMILLEVGIPIYDWLGSFLMSLQHWITMIDYCTIILASQSVMAPINIMSAPVALTKISVPPVQRELAMRPRLMERLARGLDSKLILVSAPAGYGKTMLLAAWAAQCGMPVAWVSLDESVDLFI
jgi:hypothetical protein